MPPPPARTRKSTPRTRTGCQTCRTRRIRCDEQRPACQHCQRSGWSCPGYTSTSPAQPSPVTVYRLPPNIPGSQADRHALHYFAVAAAADIGGYFSADFWTRAILQRSQHDAPVRHAVAALSRVHREYVCCDARVAFAAGEEVVTAYVRAMKALRRYMRREGEGTVVDRRVVMMCCAAFFCFELIRGEQGAALGHLRSGVEVLREWQMERPASWSTAHEGDRLQLIDVFARMDLQASAFDDGVTLTSRRCRLDSEPANDRLSDPSACSSLGLPTAKYSMLLRRCFNFLIESAPQRRSGLIEAEARRTQDGLLTELEAWEQHLPDLKKAEIDADLSLHLNSAIARSKFHSSMIRVLIQQCLLSDPERLPGVRRPSLDDKADDLLRLASEAIETSSEQNHRAGDAPAKRHFCLHLGIIAPLFLLALKTCRRDVRESCLALLGRCRGRREGLYDADVIVQVIEVVRGRDDEAAAGSLLHRMGDAAVNRLHEAVERVVPAKDDGARRTKGLCQLLAIVG